MSLFLYLQKGLSSGFVCFLQLTDFSSERSNYQEIADLYNSNTENEEFRQMFLDYFKLGDIVE